MGRLGSAAGGLLMYSRRLFERQLEDFARKGLKFAPQDEATTEKFTTNLSKAVDPQGHLTRQLTFAEKTFILNENVLTAASFEYWLKYCTIELDGTYGGGLARLKITESQRILLDKIAKLEEEQTEAVAAGMSVGGILIADHKARQVFHTALARALMLHRATRLESQRCAAISVDEEKKFEVYRRDKIIYDNLPWWIRPALKFDVKNEHVEFSTGAHVRYFAANKASSLGQGQQYDFGHATELSEYDFPQRMELDFFPTLPLSPKTLCVLESRANGRGNWWHEFSEKVRLGRKQRWTYCFVPWYSDIRKYSLSPPATWEPDETTTLHAKMVYETSPGFMGRNITLTKSQMYWWEITRREYAESGSLALFLSNFCATPEESFQHTGQSAFPPEILEKMRLTALGGVPYEFERIREAA